MKTDLPLYKMQVVPTTTPAALGAGPCVLKAFLIFGGSGATSVEFKNAATDTGTVLLSANTPIADSRFFDLSEIGGIRFDVGCFAKPAGTGGIVYCWFE